MKEKNEIENFEELKEAFGDRSDEVCRALEQFVELIPQIPGVAATMVKKNLGEKKNAIDQDFEEIDSERLLQQLELGIASGIRKNRNADWEKARASDNRSEKITKAVTKVKTKSSDTRAKMADGAIKVTSVIGKGLALFGQKGTAKKLQDKVSRSSKNFVLKDSRIGNIMERVADFGFAVGDGVKKYAENVRTGFKDADRQTDLNYMNLARESSSKKAESRQWQNAHEDNSEIVTGTVGKINDKSLRFSEILQIGKIKLTSLGAKGAALTGKKGLAQKVAEQGFNLEDNLVNRGSRIGKFAEKMAESGFLTADRFRSDFSQAKENIEAYARAGVDMAKEGIEDGKKAAKREIFKIGKATYKGAATVHGLGKFTLKQGKRGVNFISGKISEAQEFASDRIEDAQEFVSDRIEDVKDFKDTAQKKVGFLRGKSISFLGDKVQRLGEMLVNSGKDTKVKGEAIMAKNTKTAQKNMQVNERKQEDEGMEI